MLTWYAEDYQKVCGKIIDKLKVHNHYKYERWMEDRNCHCIRGQTKTRDGYEIYFGTHCYPLNPGKSSYVLIRGKDGQEGERGGDAGEGGQAGEGGYAGVVSIKALSGEGVACQVS